MDFYEGQKIWQNIQLIWNYVVGVKWEGTFLSKNSLKTDIKNNKNEQCAVLQGLKGFF